MHIRDTYNCDYLAHTIFSTLSIFSKISISLPNFAFLFTVKSPIATQIKDRFLKKMLLKRATRRLFRNIIGHNNDFTLIEKKKSYKIAEFEFKVTIHYGLWAKCTQLWPLKGLSHPDEKDSLTEVLLYIVLINSIHSLCPLPCQWLIEYNVP